MNQNIVTKVLKIDGMTCVSCENKIESKLNDYTGVTSAKASYSSGTATITFDDDVIHLNEIEATIEALDYKVVHPTQKIESADKKSNATQIVGAGIVIFALYMLIKRFGGFSIFNSFPEAERGMGYGMLFLIGVLTSIHCVAMCGGISLSQCVPQAAKGTDDNKFSTLRPSILYNLGRVISYTIIGGIVGAIGSFISFSGAAKGIVQLIAGIFMVIMGLNILNIFPWLRKLNPRMPKIFARKINSQKRSNSPLYVGLLNGLMPCGPLQAMQLYALSTGNAFNGAISMLLFSLGTVPLMFGLGALSSFLSKRFTSKMMTASAVLVIVLGVFMFNSGMSLSGFAFDFPSETANAQNGNVAKAVDGVQTVTTTLSSGSYEPITVQKGIPVKWIIQAEASNINGCNNRIIIPKYNIEKKLVPGDNIIEFTPTESGTVPFSCWMGMINSSITIVDDVSSVNVAPSNDANNLNIFDSLNSSTDPKMPTDEIAVATAEGDAHVVEINIDDAKFSPAIVVVQRGVETTWKINASKINSSNSSIIIPLYNAQVEMKEGQNLINFEPVVDFDFSTADKAFYGYVKVVEDLRNVDVEAIKNEVKEYVLDVSSYSAGTDTNGTGGASPSGGAPSCH